MLLLNQLFRSKLPHLAVRYIFDGDSQTASAYPALFMVDHPRTPSVNYASGGQTIDNLLADAAAQVDPTYPGYRNTIVMCWIGANDLGAVPATTYNKIVQYHQGRRAVPYKTAAFTVLPRGDAEDWGGTTEAWEANRLALNTLIRTNWASFADYLIDVANCTYLQDCNDTVYFNVDTVHLTDAGYAEVAFTAGAVRPEVLTNTSFELGAGDAFTGWSNTENGGSIVQETALVHGGSRAVKCINGATLQAYIYAAPFVLPNRQYRFEFWTRGTGAIAGATYINEWGGDWSEVAANQTTGVTGTTYQKVTREFVIPAGVTQIGIDFCAATGEGAFAYFDDVSLKLID